MKIRIYNARVLSMKKDCKIIDGEVHTDGSKITFVGKKDEGVKRAVNVSFDREIDARGDIVMPGFKDAHTHSAMTFLRSYADDLPLHEWLNDRVFPLEAKLTEDDIYWCSRLAILEYLTSGITTAFDMYMMPGAMAKASVDSGFRTVLCGCINDFTSSIEECEDNFNTFNNYNELISYKYGFHAEYTTGRERLEGLAELAERYNAPVYAHIAETRSETDDCIKRYGMTPISFLDSIGMFKNGGGGFHCVYMTEEDMDICRERGIYAITNPASNLKLASGIAPLCAMKDKGVDIAIGTDGPASNNCLDMFREMFLATALQKVSLSDAAALDAVDVLRMATVNGALSMGLNNCDVLEEGKCADMIMIDLNQPNMQPLNNVVKNIVYSGSKQNVRMTMINGKILYEDNKFDVGASAEEIYEKANQSIARIVSSKY